MPELSYEDFKKMRSQGMSVNDIAKAPSAPGPLQQVTSGVVRQLPILGGAIGSIPGLGAGPGLGTLLGAAGGRAIQQVIPPEWGGEAAPQTLGDVGTGLLHQGQSGATNLALGQGPEELLNELRPVAQRLAAASMAKYAGNASKVGKTAIKERIAPSFLRDMGKKADALVDQMRGRVNSLLGQARAEGRWHDPAQIARGSNELYNNPALTQADKRLLDRWDSQYLEGKTWQREGGKRVAIEPKLQPPDELNMQRQAWDNEAKGVIQARKAGMFVPPGKTQLRAKWAEAQANNARQLLHDTEAVGPTGISPGVPGLREAHRDLSEAISLKEAIKPGEKALRGRLLPYAPAGGAAILGAALPAHDWRERVLHGVLLGGAASPQGLGSAALTLSNPALGPALANLLRGAGAVTDATLRPPGTAP